MNNLNKRTTTERFVLVDYDERVLATFSTTKDVENATTHAQICMVFDYTSDDCMILSADDVNDEEWLCLRDECEYPNIDEYIDLY